MMEAEMTLLKDWTGQDLCGWLATEKLDGCRAYWDGQHLWTRGGNIIADLPRLSSQLPPRVHLDGEVHAGRGGFETARLAVQFGRDNASVRFTAFDAPQAAGTYAERLEAARAVWCDVAEAWPVHSSIHLAKLFNDIHDNGGEGLVCRHPAATGYETGRSPHAIRIKSMS